MKTMTLNLTEKEMDVLKQMAEAKGMSKTALLRQALRLYQLVDKEMEKGGSLRFSWDDPFPRKLLVVA